MTFYGDPYSNGPMRTYGLNGLSPFLGIGSSLAGMTGQGNLGGMLGLANSLISNYPTGVPYSGGANGLGALGGLYGLFGLPNNNKSYGKFPDSIGSGFNQGQGYGAFPYSAQNYPPGYGSMPGFVGSTPNGGIPGYSGVSGYGPPGYGGMPGYFY